MAESVRDVINDILRDCRAPEVKCEQYHERISKAIWRDRLDAHEVFAAAKIAKEGASSGFRKTKPERGAPALS